MGNELLFLLSIVSNFVLVLPQKTHFSISVISRLLDKKKALGMLSAVRKMVELAKKKQILIFQMLDKVPNANEHPLSTYLFII